MSENNGHAEIKGVLASMGYGCFSGSKRDPKTTKQVNEQRHAADDAGSWTNKLFPPSTCGKKNSFTELRSHLSAMRSLHYQNTFQFEDQVWRILPEKRIIPYKQTIEVDGKERAFELMEKFISDLPELIDLARLGRSDGFLESDYPTPEDVRAKFYYGVHYRPIPSSVGLNKALMQDAIDELNALHAQRLQEANTALVERFMAPFRTLKDQLENPEHRKISTVMGTIIEITGMVESLDLSGNSDLVASAKQMHDLFAGLRPELVKSDEEVRKMLATTCTSVLDRFGAIGKRAFA